MTDERSGYVLVVGNRGPERADLVGILERAGMEVAAASVSEVILVDDLMPPAITVFDDPGEGRDALSEAQRRLQAHPPLVGVPLLILTSKGDIDSFTGAITKGAAAYMLKPAASSELIDTARRLTNWKDTHGRTEKRRRLRRPLIMKVELEVKGSEATRAGQLIDVSSKGCRIELPEASSFEHGQKIKIVLHGPQGSTHMALGGQICWQRQEGGAQQIGLRFSGSTAQLAPTILGAPGARPAGVPGSDPGS